VWVMWLCVLLERGEDLEGMSEACNLRNHIWCVCVGGWVWVCVGYVVLCVAGEGRGTGRNE